MRSPLKFNIVSALSLPCPQCQQLHRHHVQDYVNTMSVQSTTTRTPCPGLYQHHVRTVSKVKDYADTEHHVSIVDMGVKNLVILTL